MKQVLYICAISIVGCFFSNTFANDNIYIGDLKDYHSNLTAKIEAKLLKTSDLNKTTISSEEKKPLSTQPVDPPKIRETISVATFTYSKYNFDWIIFPGGWYWSSTDEYSSFYSIDQGYEDYAAYKATLALKIYRVASTAYDMAVVGITVANGVNATIYENKTQTTFNGYSASYNSYAFTSSGINYSVDQWYFTVSGTTYSYSIFTTVSDWNANNAIYGIMKIGLLFTPTSTEPTESLQNIPHISYVPNLNGSITFSGVPANSDLFIYDMSGKLIRRVTGNCWDGLTNT